MRGEKNPKKCTKAGCDQTVSTGGARGMCQHCYRQFRIKVLHKQETTPEPKIQREPSAHEDSSITLPRRKPFEWLGSLQESISAIAQEE